MTPRQQSRTSGLWLFLLPPRRVVKTLRWPEEQLHSSPARSLLACFCKCSLTGGRNFFPIWASDPRGTPNAPTIAFLRGAFRCDLLPSQLGRRQTLLRHAVYPACSLFCTLLRNIQRGVKNTDAALEKCLIKEACEKMLRSWALSER